MTEELTRPSVTFACELDAARLTELFADGSVIDDLQALGARVTMMVSDLSVERAHVVRQLNQAGIPLVGIPLFSAEEGYYFTVDNAPRAAHRYQQWKQWTAEHGLVWEQVGLDIEPEAQFYLQLMANPWGLVPRLLRRLRNRERVVRARAAYAELVDQIHTDGWPVENYQFPFIADERRAGSTLLQRLMGLVDVRTDCEVLMQYTSFVGPLGPGILWSYGPESDAIAVGTTGGGPDVPGHPQFTPLRWEELTRDLRLARRWTDQLYVHSLEGCVWNGYLAPLRSLNWTPASTPPETATVAGLLRAGLRGVLRISVHPWRTAGLVAALLWLFARRPTHPGRLPDRRGHPGLAARLVRRAQPALPGRHQRNSDASRRRGQRRTTASQR